MRKRDPQPRITPPIGLRGPGDRRIHLGDHHRDQIVYAN